MVLSNIDEHLSNIDEHLSNFDESRMFTVIRHIGLLRGLSLIITMRGSLKIGKLARLNL